MGAPITSHFKGIWIRPTPPIWKSNMVSSIRNRDPPGKLHLAKMGRIWTIWESTLTRTNWMRIWCLLEVSRNYQVVARQLISNTLCNSNRQMFPQMTSLRVKWNGLREIKKWTKLGFKVRSTPSNPNWEKRFTICKRYIKLMLWILISLSCIKTSLKKSKLIKKTKRFHSKSLILMRITYQMITFKNIKANQFKHPFWVEWISQDQWER